MATIKDFRDFLNKGNVTAAQVAAELAEYVEEGQGNHRLAKAAASSLWDAVQALEGTDL